MSAPSSDLAGTLAASLVERADGASALAAAAAALGERFDGACVIYLRSDAQRGLVPVAGAHPDPAVAASLQEFTADARGWTGSRLTEALGQGKTVLSAGTPAELATWATKDVRGHIVRNGFDSLLAVPVRAHDEIVAALMVSRRKPQPPPDASDRSALELLAVELAAALDNARLAFRVREELEALESAEDALQIANQRFSAAFRDAAIGMALFTVGDEAVVALEVNRALAALLGRTPEEIVALPDPTVLVHPEDVGTLLPVLERLRAGEVSWGEMEQRLLPVDGPPLACLITLSLIRDAAGAPLYGFAQIQDLSAGQREQELTRHVRRQDLLASLTRRALERAPIGDLAAQAAGMVASTLNADLAWVLARTPAQTAAVLAAAGGGIDLAGAEADALELLDGPCVLGGGGPPLPATWRERGVRGAIGAPTGRAAARTGWLAAFTRSERAFGDAELSFLEAVAHVLTSAGEREALEGEVRRRALHDLLTGLPNRTLLADRMTSAIARAMRTGGAIAVLRLDVDRLDDVNDMLGHDRGNELLRVVAERLQRVLRSSDTLAHVGAGGFVVLCSDIRGERGAIEVVQRLAAALDAPVVLDERELHVTASVGVVVTDGRSASAEALVRDADVAMHRAKLRPNTSYELFDAEMRQRAIERLDLEQDIRRALSRDEFTLHYQPLVSLRERRIVGVEALVRWQHPVRGLLSPAAFIPVAEESGLIVALGEWVLDEACRQLARWAADPTLAAVFMSVNLSGRQLVAPGLPEEVEETLRRTGVPADRLALELTETVLMEETSSPAAVLQRLQALGVRLMLDDFGTGYSSLNYVKRFPLAAIKIDRSFIAGIADDESDRHILRAIVSMSSALDVSVIAEGVETLEQASWLASIGCDVAQGFGLARPAPARDVEPLLRSGLPAKRLAWSSTPPSTA